MRNQLWKAMAEVFAGHHGEVIGTLTGAIIAIAILCFGFWRTAFVACVALIGLYIGRESDKGVDVFGRASDSVLRFLNRVQHRGDSFRNRRDLW